MIFVFNLKFVKNRSEEFLFFQAFKNLENLKLINFFNRQLFLCPQHFTLIIITHKNRINAINVQKFILVFKSKFYKTQFKRPISLTRNRFSNAKLVVAFGFKVTKRYAAHPTRAVASLVDLFFFVSFSLRNGSVSRLVGNILYRGMNRDRCHIEPVPSGV